MKLFSPILIPAVIAGVCWLISWRLWNRRHLASRGHWGGALALALGYAAGYRTLMGWPPFPANTAVQWLVYLALLAGAVALAEPLWRKKSWLRFAVWLGLGALTAWLQFQALVEHTWTTSQAIQWIGGLALATAALCAALDALAERRAGASLPLAFWLTAAVTSGVLLLTKSALLGQLAGSLAGIFGAAAVLAWWAPGIRLSRGAMTVFGLLFVALLSQGHLYSELSLLGAALLYLAPFAAWLGEVGLVKGLRPSRAVLVRMVLVAIPLAVALLIAFLEWRESSAVSDYQY